MPVAAEWDEVGDTLLRLADYTGKANTAHAGPGSTSGEEYMSDFTGNAVRINAGRLEIDRHAGYQVTGVYSPVDVDGGRMRPMLRGDETTGVLDDTALGFFFNATVSGGYPNAPIEIRFEPAAAVGDSVTFTPRQYRAGVFVAAFAAFTIDMTHNVRFDVWKSGNSPTVINWRIWDETDALEIATGNLSDGVGVQTSAGRCGFFLYGGDGTTNPIKLRAFELNSISLIPPLLADGPETVSSTATTATNSVPAPSGGVGPYTFEVWTASAPSSDIGDYTLRQAATAIAADTTWTDPTLGAGNSRYMILVYEDSEARTHTSPPLAYTSAMALPLLLALEPSLSAEDLPMVLGGDSRTFLKDETELEDFLQGGTSGTVDVRNKAMNGSNSDHWLWDAVSPVEFVSPLNELVAEANLIDAKIVVFNLGINDSNTVTGVGTIADYISNMTTILNELKDRIPTLEEIYLHGSFYAKAEPWPNMPDHSFTGITHESLQWVLDANAELPGIIAASAAARPAWAGQVHLIDYDFYRLFVQEQSAMDPDGLHIDDGAHTPEWSIGGTYINTVIANAIAQQRWGAGATDNEIAALIAGGQLRRMKMGLGLGL
jgi:hypothetical protein